MTEARESEWAYSDGSAVGEHHPVAMARATSAVLSKRTPRRTAVSALPVANDPIEPAITILPDEPHEHGRQLGLDAGQANVDVIVGPDLRGPVMAILIEAGFLARFWQQGEAFVRAASKLAAGCVLIDVRKPDRSGLMVQQAIRAAGLNWPLVAIMSAGDVPTTVQVLKAGAETVVEAPIERQELEYAIRTAAHRLIEVEASEDVRHAYRCLSLLTRRETEVLRGLVAGLPNKTIAYDLGISPRTVEVYRANIMHKFEARSLSDVLRSAFAAKFV